MSILVFLLGRVFPRKWLCPNSFPFKSYAFEKEGKLIRVNAENSKDAVFDEITAKLDNFFGKTTLN